MAKLIIPLNELEYQDLALVGGKTAHLRILTLQGFSVPETLIVTGKVYDKFVHANSDILKVIEQLKRSDKQEQKKLLEFIIDKIHQLEFTDEFQNILLNYLPAIHFPHFSNAAVRHSIILKELPTVNLPGFHKSFLNISNFGQLLEAIKLVWASHWSAQSFKYRVDNCIPHEQTSMAVIVQRMCKSDYSGTCLTSFQNKKEYVKVFTGWGLPAGVSREEVPTDEIMIRCNNLSGGSPVCEVVEEKINPKDQMLIFKGGEEKIVETAPGMVNAKILNKKEYNILGDMAKKIESIFNRPLKLVWAHDKDFLLLNVFDDESAISRDETIWMHTMFSMLSGELPSILSNSVIERLIQAELEKMAREMGNRDGEFPSATTVLLGRVYINLDFITGLFDQIKVHPDTTARYLEGFSIFMRDVSGESMMDNFKIGALESIKVNKWLNKVRTNGKANVEKVAKFVENMKAIDFKETDLKVMGKTIENILDNMDMLQGHMNIISALILQMNILYSLIKDKNTSEIFARLPQLETIFDVDFLDDMIALYNIGVKDPDVKELLTRKKLEIGDLDPIKDSEFTKKMKQIIQKYDYISAYPMELSNPRINEDPTMVFRTVGQLMRDELKHNFSSAYANEVIPKKKDFPDTGGSKNPLLSLLPIGGWNIKDTEKGILELIQLNRYDRKILFQLFAQLRKAVLAVAKQFKKSKMIDSEEDIFFLEMKEVLGGAQSSYVEFAKIIKERKNNYKIWREYFTPDVYSGTRLNISPVNFEPGGGKGKIRGIPVYPGKVKGKAYKIKKYEDFWNLKSDSIPIVERLSPTMAPLLVNVAGVIIEENGPMPNDIILLRRMQKPSVSGFPGLRRLLRNGDPVEIDGERGILHLLDNGK